MADFKKLDDEHNNTKLKTPEENIRHYCSYSFHSKSPGFPKITNHNQNSKFLMSDIEFYESLIESQRISCMNREALRIQTLAEIPEKEDENNENLYFDKNEVEARKKISIFDKNEVIPAKRQIFQSII